jgi:hypothetical protein
MLIRTTAYTAFYLLTYFTVLTFKTQLAFSLFSAGVITKQASLHGVSFVPADLCIKPAEMTFNLFLDKVVTCTSLRGVSFIPIKHCSLPFPTGRRFPLFPARAHSA